jgi:hypothetical protein
MLRAAMLHFFALRPLEFGPKDTFTERYRLRLRVDELASFSRKS